MRIVAVSSILLVLSVAADAANCGKCDLPAPEGTMACWACGAHIPGAPHPDKVLKLDLTPARIKVKEAARKVDDAAISPEVAYEAVNAWIKKNPKKYDEAISRLEEFMVTARGTGLELAITRRITDLKAAKARENKPRSLDDRRKEAARAYPKIMGQIKSQPDRVLQNIKLLEGLLELSKGTPYESLVKKKLESEKAKSPR